MISEFLKTSQIKILTEDHSRAELFQNAINLMENEAVRLAAIASLKSEVELPFGSLEDGILIPHFKVSGIKNPEVVFFIIVNGIAAEKEGIHLSLFLATPEDKPALHLQLLQGLSSLLPQVETELLACKTAEQVISVIKSGEDKAKPSYKNLKQKQVEFELQSNFELGLTEEEAKRRLLHFGPNQIEKHKSVPWYFKLLKNFFSFFAILLWIAALLCFIPGVDMPQLGWAVLIVIILNGFFSFLQESRSDKAVEALGRLMAQSSRVVRSGKERDLPAFELVAGDIIILQEGDVVPADCRLIDSSDVEIDNSSLTGESTSAKRYKSDKEILLEGKFLWLELPNILFAGTSLIKGQGKAVVFGTGMSTEIGQIAQLTADIKVEQSPLQKQLQSTVFAISLLAMGIAVSFLFLGWLGAGLTFIQAFIFCIGIFVANVPEGLLPTVTLSLAMGVSRMAKRNAIVKDLASVETLGCTTVICSDKTGTLTQNMMMVVGLITSGRWVEIRASGLEKKANFFRDNKELSARDLLTDHSVSLLLACATLCNNAKLDRNESGTKIVGDPTEGALLLLAERSEHKVDQKRIHLNPFDSVRKRMSVIALDISNEQVCFAKGAPAELLSVCSRYLLNGAVIELNEESRIRILNEADDYAKKGYRILGFAYREAKSLAKLNGIFDTENTERDLIYIGITAMADPIRPTVPNAIHACHTAGIRIIMVTGDHPLT